MGACFDKLYKKVSQIEADLRAGKIDLKEALRRHNAATEQFSDCMKISSYMKKYKEAIKRIERDS